MGFRCQNGGGGPNACDVTNVTGSVTTAGEPRFRGAPYRFFLTNPAGPPGQPPFFMASGVIPVEGCSPSGQRDWAAAMQKGVAIAVALSRAPSAFVVRSRPIGRGYDLSTARHIWAQPALVRAAKRQRRRQLPMSGKSGIFDSRRGGADATRQWGDRARTLQTIGTGGAGGNEG